MANKIIRFVLAIVIVGALAFGIYTILPGQFKNPITEWVQEMFDEDAKEMVDALKSTTVVKHSDVTYDQMMLSATANPAWTVKKISVDSETGYGEYEVYADGYQCTIEMTSDTSTDSNKTLTNAHVRLVFQVTKDADGMRITGKTETLTAGKQTSPYMIQVAEEEYLRDDKESGYYQGTLDCMVRNVSK